MPLTRRGFVRTLGLGGAAVLSSTSIIGRGREALAWESGLAQQPDDAHMIKISSNENARGPGPKALEALHGGISTRIGRGYPPDHREALVSTIASVYGIEPENVLIATGSGAILQAGVRAFCSATKKLVTAEPSYLTPNQMAERMGAGITLVPTDGLALLNLDAMAEAASGAGMVFLCNPNNPTGTVHSARAVEDFVRRVKQRSPATNILIDEAYFDYVMNPAVKTAASLAMEYPGVFITRSFSKAHGMAGLRLGYAVGQAETLQAIGRAWGLGSVNTLSAAAGVASLKDPGHIAAERQENHRIREFAIAAFKDMGFASTASETNFIFVNLGRPAREFREACRAHGVQVGRDFPPMEQTHSRISLGTMEEMQKSIQVFRQVLATPSNSAAN